MWNLSVVILSVLVSMWKCWWSPFSHRVPYRSCIGQTAGILNALGRQQDCVQSKGFYYRNFRIGTFNYSWRTSYPCFYCFAQKWNLNLTRHCKIICLDEPEHITSWLSRLSTILRTVTQSDSADVERAQESLISHDGRTGLSHIVLSETAEPQPSCSHKTAVEFRFHRPCAFTGLHSPLMAISSVPAQRLFSPLNLTLSETGNQSEQARCQDKGKPPLLTYPSRSAWHSERKSTRLSPMWATGSPAGPIHCLDNECFGPWLLPLDFHGVPTAGMKGAHIRVLCRKPLHSAGLSPSHRQRTTIHWTSHPACRNTH